MAVRQSTTQQTMDSVLRVVGDAQAHRLSPHGGAPGAVVLRGRLTPEQKDVLSRYFDHEISESGIPGMAVVTWIGPYDLDRRYVDDETRAAGRSRARGDKWKRWP